MRTQAAAKVRRPRRATRVFWPRLRRALNTFAVLAVVSCDIQGWCGEEGGAPGGRVEDEHHAAIHHVPLIPRQAVQRGGDEVEVRDPERGQHGLLPEAAAAEEAGEGVDDAEGQDAFDGSRDDAQRQRVRVVLVPRLHVKRHRRCAPLATSSRYSVWYGMQLTSKQREHRLPALAQVHGRGEEEDFERGVDRVDAVVEELAQGTALASSSSLAAVHSIEGLV